MKAVGKKMLLQFLRVLQQNILPFKSCIVLLGLFYITGSKWLESVRQLLGVAIKKVQDTSQALTYVSMSL